MFMSTVHLGLSFVYNEMHVCTVTHSVTVGVTISSSRGSNARFLQLLLWQADSLPLGFSTYLCPFQFSSVTQLCLTLCDPINCSTPGLPVHHQLLEFTHIHVHWVGDAIQQSHPLSSPSPPVLNLSQHQGLYKWVSSSYQVAKVLGFQPQYQSFQWTFRTDFL